MTLLPIVDRELRASARRKSTFRLRWWAALAAVLISGCSLLFIGLAQGPGQLGGPLFSVLSAYAFGLCLLFGVLLTSDCLSEEKREGTLGLLFLTELKGYDVVLGKFAAHSLNAFYGLLTILPIIAVPLLLGGVTGGEFWRTTLALLNALFFSLAAGVWISTLVRDSQNAMGLALALLLVLAGALPALAEVGALARLLPAWFHPEWVSPFYPFSCARDANYLGDPGKFWGTLAASQTLGWGFLALASLALPRLWQQRTLGGRSPAILDRLLRQGRGGHSNRTHVRAKLLPNNPVLWLMGRQPAWRSLVWVIVLSWGITITAVSWSSPMEPLKLAYAAKGCGFLLKLLIAMQACRFFAESRRDGALELLLCTPLRNGEILKGQWLAMKRVFLAPLVVFVLVNFIPITFQLASAASRQAPSELLSGLFHFGIGFAVIGWFTLHLIADILALGWLGMWLALSVKKPSLAPALTILFVPMIRVAAALPAV